MRTMSTTRFFSRRRRSVPRKEGREDGGTRQPRMVKAGKAWVVYMPFAASRDGSPGKLANRKGAPEPSHPAHQKAGKFQDFFDSLSAAKARSNRETPEKKAIFLAFLRSSQPVRQPSTDAGAKKLWLKAEAERRDLCPTLERRDKESGALSLACVHRTLSARG